MRRGYIDGPAGQLHYCDSGSGAPALLLLHQAPLSSRQFDRVYPLFAEAGVRVLGVDMPGLGHSDPMGCDEAPPTVEEYAQIIPALLDALGIAVVHLCGHHTGAMLAVEASLRWPERIVSVAMSGPAPLTADEQQEFMSTIVDDEKAYSPQADGAHLMQLWHRRIGYLPPGDASATLCTGYILQPMLASAPFWYAHHAAFSYDMTAALERVTHPTLVIANTSDMIYHLAERTMAMRPDFQHVELEGGGVDPTDLLSELWTEAVLSFIGDCEAEH